MQSFGDLFEPVQQRLLEHANRGKPVDAARATNARWKSEYTDLDV